MNFAYKHDSKNKANWQSTGHSMNASCFSSSCIIHSCCCSPFFYDSFLFACRWLEKPVIPFHIDAVYPDEIINHKHSSRRNGMNGTCTGNSTRMTSSTGCMYTHTRRRPFNLLYSIGPFCAYLFCRCCCDVVVVRVFVLVAVALKPLHVNPLE